MTLFLKNKIKYESCSTERIENSDLLAIRRSTVKRKEHNTRVPAIGLPSLPQKT